MRDTSKLTRKIITNKLGHKQTVWVSTESRMPYKEAKDKYKDLKVSKEEMEGKWSKDHKDYFKNDGDKLVSIDDIMPIRKREQGVENGRKIMALSQRGKVERRKPLTVEVDSEGKYKLVDGNSTYHLLKHEIGIDKVPVTIQKK